MTTQAHEYMNKLRRLYIERANLDADIKEAELEAKAFGVNVATARKWLKAEVADEMTSGMSRKIEKLAANVVDMVIYGESLGHDLGIFQNNASEPNAIVRNNSNPPPVADRNSQAGARDAVPPVQSEERQGDAGGASQAPASPINSASAPQGQRDADSGAGSPTAPASQPIQAEGSSAGSAVRRPAIDGDNLEIPEFLNAKNREAAHG